LNVGVVAGFLLMGLAMLHPFLQRAFDVVPLSLPQWGLLLMMGLVKLGMIEMGKEAYLFYQKRIVST